MTQGYIYILKNQAFIENLLKIGYTKRDVEIRAKELDTTGVPHPFYVVYVEDVSNYQEIEKIIHQKLDEYRYNRRREFFKLPLEQAIAKVQEVTQREIYKRKGEDNIWILKENMTIRWLCSSDDIIFISCYKSLMDIASNTPDIINVWTCREGQQILISNRPGSKIFAVDTNEFVTLDVVGECINGVLSGLEDIYSGYRIAWVGKGQINSHLKDDYSVFAILDCRADAKLALFSDPKNTSFEDVISSPYSCDVSKVKQEQLKILNEAYMKIKKLGAPRRLRIQ